MENEEKKITDITYTNGIVIVISRTHRSALIRVARRFIPRDALSFEGLVNYARVSIVRYLLPCYWFQVDGRWGENWLIWKLFLKKKDYYKPNGGSEYLHRISGSEAERKQNVCESLEWEALGSSMELFHSNKQSAKPKTNNK